MRLDKLTTKFQGSPVRCQSLALKRLLILYRARCTCWHLNAPGGRYAGSAPACCPGLLKASRAIEGAGATRCRPARAGAACDYRRRPSSAATSSSQTKLFLLALVDSKGRAAQIARTTASQNLEAATSAVRGSQKVDAEAEEPAQWT